MGTEVPTGWKGTFLWITIPREHMLPSRCLVVHGLSGHPSCLRTRSCGSIAVALEGWLLVFTWDVELCDWRWLPASRPQAAEDLLGPLHLTYGVFPSLPPGLLWF